MDAEDREELDKQIVDQIEIRMEEESRWDDTEDTEFESKLESLIEEYSENQSDAEAQPENDAPADNDDAADADSLNAKNKKYLMYAQIVSIIAIALTFLFGIIIMFIRAASLKPVNLEEIFHEEDDK